ncbi:MAG: glutamate synthase [Elusimicrobia bacterium]|nr:glutamate synthase [Elusimicrobiota bacterium]
MAELIPYPFGKLLKRMFRELELKGSIFDLPLRQCFLGDPAKDFSVKFHGLPASTPYGPAAGPHSQLAQNIVLSWLGGSRIIELKTVQINDELKIPRPCIDMHNVGYNVEWSQELKLQQSVEEYVKASMLIEILAASGRLPLAKGFNYVIFDMSVGYDLAGIHSAPMREFVREMMDASRLIEKLRREIPKEFAGWRSLNFNPRLVKTLTLSTFHGCPPDEIERIIRYFLTEAGLHCVVKLNPTLLGKKEARRLLNGELGYRDVMIPDSAFEKDTRWEQAAEFVESLGRTAAERGLGFGVKFSNTLIVENKRSFFPSSEKVMYLSGRPLHVLAMHLVRKFRKAFGMRYPISFAGGVDRLNFPEAVALGLTPITACSDLLKPGGYGRSKSYFQEIVKRMDAVGAASVGEFVLRAWGHGEAALRKNPDESLQERVARAALLNTESYVSKLAGDPRYHFENNRDVPKKIGSRLKLFNCITCDKCVPVCPNDANFTYSLPAAEIPVVKLVWNGSDFEEKETDKLIFDKKHQIGNFADFCNECGNCDVFCPEDGGPYVLKPRFFGSLDSWRRFKDHDGFYLDRSEGEEQVWGRFGGKEFFLKISESKQALYEGEGFRILFWEQERGRSIQNHAKKPAAGAEIDMTYFHIMNWLRKAIFSPKEINYINV